MANGTCEVDGCERRRQYKRYCNAHYRRWKRNGDPGTAILGPPPREPRTCRFEDCGRQVRTLGLCASHYLQQFHGKDLKPLRPYIDTTVRDEQGRKQCSTCFGWKPVEGFRPNKRIKNGYHSYCRACDHKRRVKSSYGIEPAEYDRLLDEQGGLCAICGGVNRDGRMLFVDHDCNLCNRGLGNFHDSVRILNAAARYLGEEGAGCRERAHEGGALRSPWRQS